MSEQTLSPENQMMQWITSKWITKPIYIISELGIADLLRDGPKRLEDLAMETNTHSPTLYRILRALSSVGIFHESENKTFSLTPLAECLLSDALRPIARMFLSPWHDKAWNGLSHAVRTGEAGFDHAFGKPSFEWFEENVAERLVLDQGQGSKAIGFAQAITESYDFSDIDSICDIGGGQGDFLIHLLTKRPDLQGCIADLPGAVKSADRAIARANLKDRCKAVSYNFHNETPPVCDAYFLVNILHNWKDATCTRILENITRVMIADSRLWILEYILEPGPGFSVAKLLDLEVLVMSGGRERSIKEFEVLANAAGLMVSKIIPTENGPTMLECIKK